MKVEFKYKGKIVGKEIDIAALLIGITTFTTFYMYLITEFFSAFQALNGRNVKVAWGILFLGIVLLKFRYSIKIYVNKFIWKDNKILIPVFLIGMVVGLIALFTVPYNFDSMTYHLARVVNWEQNQSINFYATNNDRQVFNSPLAEYAILNIKLLFQIENLYNMVQYYAYIASSIVIYGICKKIRISKTCGQIACLIFMTAPIITIEATTTQNDLYACMWALFGIYILVSYINIESYKGNVNPIGIRSCYDEGKRCAETLCFDYNREFGTRIKVIRIFNTYGPNMDPEDGRVISNLILQTLRGQDITLYGDGRQTRSFCYIDDLVEGICRMMESDDEFLGPVNLGNPDEFTIRELADILLEMISSDSKITYCPLPSDDPMQRKPDISMAYHKLGGWSPHILLRDGLLPTIEYFRQYLNQDS